MNFPSQMYFNDINHSYRAVILKANPLWLLPFYMAVAASCHYEKVRRTMCTAIVSHLLKSLYKHYTLNISEYNFHFKFKTVVKTVVSF